MKQLLLSLTLIVSLAGCRSNVEDHQDISTEDVIPFNATQLQTKNSKNSLDWDGTYSGVLPCDDCAGIDTFLRLKEDQTFELTKRYLDSADRQEKEEKTQGTFSWNQDGSAITLSGVDAEPKSFRVEEIYLTPLDSNGLEMRGEPGNNFKLLKL